MNHIFYKIATTYSDIQEQTVDYKIGHVCEMALRLA